MSGRCVALTAGVVVVIMVVMMACLSQGTGDDVRSEGTGGAVTGLMSEQSGSDAGQSGTSAKPADHPGPATQLATEDPLERSGIQSSVPLFVDRHGILSVQPKPLGDLGPVSLRCSVSKDQKFVYKAVQYRCDESGELRRKGEEHVQDIGMELYRVVDVDASTGAFVLERSQRQPSVITRGGTLVAVDNPTSDKLRVTISPRNEAIKVEVNGHEVSGGREKAIMPDLVWPEKEIRKGASWKVAAAGNPANVLEVKVAGFAEVQGRRCVVLDAKQVLHLSGTQREGPKPQEWQNTLTMTGSKYIDLETGAIVREETLSMHDLKVRPLGSQSSFVRSADTPREPNIKMVRQLLDIDVAS